MQIAAYHYANHSLSLRPHARYPLDKFKKLVASCRELFGDQLLLIEGGQVLKEDLLIAHTREYVNGIESGDLPEAAWRELGFIWSETLYPRSNCIVSCTVQASMAALSDGISFVLGGGAHHASAGNGRGFCVFNDLVIAAKVLLQKGQASRVLIFDCDVHQGDGSALMCANEDNITTCSIHAASNFPFKKVESDYDLGLPDEISDIEYLDSVQLTLNKMLNDSSHDFIFYVAGADPFKEDTLGRLGISREALRMRDEFVFRKCFEEELPVCVVFGGGYCDPIDGTVRCNVNTIDAALKTYTVGTTEGLGKINLL